MRQGPVHLPPNGASEQWLTDREECPWRSSVGTAADVFETDLGIAGGVITAIGRGLGPARRDFDPSGRYALPDVGLAGRIRRLVGHNHFTILEELADRATCSAVANGAAPTRRGRRPDPPTIHAI